MYLLLRILVMAVSLASSSLASGQFDPDSKSPLKDIDPPDVIHWQPAGGQVFQDKIVETGLRLFTEQDFTLYIDKVKFEGPEGFELKKLEKPTTQKLIDPISGKEVDVYTDGDFLLFFEGLEAYAGSSFPVKVTYLGCTARICLFPYTETVHVPVFAANKPSPLNKADMVVLTGPSIDDDKTSLQPVGGIEQQWADKLSRGEFSLWMIIVVVFLGGLMTNMTPCVAPMIPITLRVLSHQNMPALLSASLYAAGIMITYSVLGSMAVLTGSAFGTFMQSSGVNLAFALIMALLGLSMLGLGDFSAIQNIGAKIGSGKPSMGNTFLMGAGAGLVAAPCTGPVLGALLTFSAGQQDAAQGILLMSTYSLGFALPYVFLGSIASKASSMRVPPMLQMFIKMTFGAVMFGLALYFLRVPFYPTVKSLRLVWGPIAGAGLAMGTILGAIWIVFAQLHHNKVYASFAALVLGTGLFAGSQWLTVPIDSDLKMYKSIDSAFAAAKKTGRPILMDNWAEWCEACKKMDVTTFKDSEVVAELNKNWIVLKIDLTEGTDQDDAHMERYGISGLPTLVLLPAGAEPERARNIIGYVSAQGLMQKLNDFKGH